MNKRNGIIAGVLAIVLLIVLGLWWRDRESQDMHMDIDIGAAAPVADAEIV